MLVTFNLLVLPSQVELNNLQVCRWREARTRTLHDAVIPRAWRRKEEKFYSSTEIDILARARTITPSSLGGRWEGA